MGQKTLMRPEPVLIYSLLLVSCLISQSIYAENRLLKIRTYMYEIDNLPASIRLALDFSEKAEKLDIQVSDESPSDLPDDYRSEFLISTRNEQSRHIFKPADIEYGNGAHG